MEERLTKPTATDHGVPQFHYDRVQRFLHWSMAAIIITAIAIGIYCGYQVPGTQPRKFLLDIHKSLGITALALVAIRIGYRVFAGAPPYSKALSSMVHASSQVAHALLYALMVFMPLSGYLFSSAGGYSLPWFGLFQWPRIVPLDKGLAVSFVLKSRIGLPSLPIPIDPVAFKIAKVGIDRLARSLGSLGAVPELLVPLRIELDDPRLDSDAT